MRQVDVRERTPDDDISINNKYLRQLTEGYATRASPH